MRLEREMVREIEWKQIIEKKAQRVAIREAQKLEKAIELAKRKENAEEKRANRIQGKAFL